MRRTSRAAVLAALALWYRSAPAQPSATRAPDEARGPGCRGPLSADRVVSCALAASPEVREARQRLAALAGRRAAAGVVLPSNPVVAATAAYRDRPPPDPATA